MKNTKIKVELDGRELFVDASTIKVSGVSLEVWFASLKEVEKKLNKLQAQLDQKEEEFKRIALDLF
jgi:tetrahydromethanopterin S-methyltransferase subunit B